MHTLEPYYNWREHYVASEDPRSPFFDREYSEFTFSRALYNHLIHPQWDEFGSSTLFMKVLFVDYSDGYCVIELMGEWNDCLHNDIMLLKRDVIEPMMSEGICRFVLIGENILNFHQSDDCYYEEWFEEVEDTDGWVALVNFRDHVLEEFEAANVDSYFVLGGKMNELVWRTLTPRQVYQNISEHVQKRLGPLI